MIISVWIFSRVHRQWTNGKYTVTEEVVMRYPVERILEIIANDTGVVYCRNSFELFELPRPEMPRRTPEEVLKLLYVPKNEISDRFYPR